MFCLHKENVLKLVCPINKIIFVCIYNHKNLTNKHSFGRGRGSGRLDGGAQEAPEKCTGCARDASEILPRGVRRVLDVSGTRVGGVSNVSRRRVGGVPEASG